MELALWGKTGLNPKGAKWYLELGQGMGATLLMASEKKGYTLSDRATYLAEKPNTKLEYTLRRRPVLAQYLSCHGSKSGKIRQSQRRGRQSVCRFHDLAGNSKAHR